MTKARIYLLSAACVLAFFGLLFAVTVVQKKAAEREERAYYRAKQEAYVLSRQAAWAGRRAELTPIAKEHFLEGRALEAFELLEPFSDVVDGEARAVFEAARPQAAEQRAERKRLNQVAAAEARAHQVRAELDRKQAIADELDAMTACQIYVERHAKHDFEWTNGWGTKFNPPVVIDGDLVLTGDSIKMQNGFGAWTIMRYSCVYDPGSKSITGIEVKPRSE